jgi:hypothetical protein
MNSGSNPAGEQAAAIAFTRKSLLGAGLATAASFVAARADSLARTETPRRRSGSRSSARRASSSSSTRADRERRPARQDDAHIQPRTRGAHPSRLRDRRRGGGQGLLRRVVERVPGPARAAVPPQPLTCSAGRRGMAPGWPRAQRKRGAGTPSCRQIAQPVGILISLWRGSTARAPVAAFSQTAWREPSRSG